MTAACRTIERSNDMTTMMTRGSRRVLPDDVRKEVDDYIWEHYHEGGATPIAIRFGIDRDYVLCRAFRIGARMTGEHLLEERDYDLIRELIMASVPLPMIAEKFDIRASVVRRIKSEAGIRLYRRTLKC